MDLAKEINIHVEALPKIKQMEVLDFVEYLHEKMAARDEPDWTAFSLGAAMRGLEDEEPLYTSEDLEESFQ